jgi:hypothetical protein
VLSQSQELPLAAGTGAAGVGFGVGLLVGPGVGLGVGLLVGQGVGLGVGAGAGALYPQEAGISWNDPLFFHLISRQLHQAIG